MSEDAAAVTSAPLDKAVGARVGAAIIDIIILAVFFGIMAALFGDSNAKNDDSGASFNLNLTGFPAFIYFAGVFCYYWLLEATRGQTVGKMIVGLRVVKADGTALSYGPAALRTALRIVDGLPFFYLLGFIVVVSSQRGQRIGDMVASTLVVRK